MKGPASAYMCKCGERAFDWAYDGTDPKEVVEERNGHACAYSTDLDRYQPMCHRCHVRFDTERRQGNNENRKADSSNGKNH